MLAADRAELAIGNEEHVTLFAVDVVNLQELRSFAALTRPRRLQLDRLDAEIAAHASGRAGSTRS